MHVKKNFGHFCEEISLHFCQSLPAGQSCTLETSLLLFFLSTATQKKREQKLLTPQFIARFHDAVTFLLAYHTVTFSDFRTSFPEIYSIFFKVHLLCSLSCSWWFKFSLWKHFFPNVKVCVLRLRSFLITSSGEILDSLLPFFHQHITVVCPFSPCQHYNLARKLVVFCVIFFNLGLYYTCSRLLFVHKIFCRCTLGAQIARTKVCKKLAEIPPLFSPTKK